MFLTDGDLDQIGERIQEAMTESWNKLEYLYATLLTGVKERIAELKILAWKVRQPVQAEENLGEERPIEPTLAAQISLISARALQFDSAKVQQQAKGWRYANMNIVVVPLQILPKLHLKIIDEMKLLEQHTS